VDSRECLMFFLLLVEHQERGAAWRKKKKSALAAGKSLLVLHCIFSLKTSGRGPRESCGRGREKKKKEKKRGGEMGEPKSCLNLSYFTCCPQIKLPEG